jgi:hypothetical protein
MGNKERGNVQTAVAERSEPHGEEEARKRQGKDREGRTGRGKAGRAYREAPSQPGRTATTERHEHDQTSTTKRTDLHLVTVRHAAAHQCSYPSLLANPVPARSSAARLGGGPRSASWNSAADGRSSAVKRRAPISVAVFPAAPPASTAGYALPAAPPPVGRSNPLGSSRPS